MSALCLGACSQSSSASGTTGSATTATTRPTPTTSSPTTTTLPAQYVKVGGHRVKVPSERGNNAPIHAYQDGGDQILITSKGFVPHILYAEDGTVVWTNLTNQTQEITIKNGAIHSGRIPPGGTFRWNATGSISFRYQSAAGQYAYLYLGLFPSK
jgi:hypothetical protein